MFPPPPFSGLPPFSRKDARDFFKAFRKIEELRLDLRQETPEDRVLDFKETFMKSAWLFHPKTKKNPASEGTRIAKLIYECALESGGDLKYILGEYWPDLFDGCRNWAGLKSDEVADPKMAEFVTNVMTPFFDAALETFKRINTFSKAGLFGEEQAINYFKDLGVVLKAMQAKSSLSRPFTPREQLIIDSTEQTEKSWLEGPEVKNNPVEEGKRMGQLLYKHASSMENEREFAMQSYFPEHLKMDSVVENTARLEMVEAVESFLANALNTFVEARDEEGNWVDA